MALVFPFGMVLTLVVALDSVIGPVPARLVGVAVSFAAIWAPSGMWLLAVSAYPRPHTRSPDEPGGRLQPG